MTLKSDAKFEEKLTIGCRNDIRNFGNLEIFILMCYFYRKYTMFERLKYRGVMCHNTEE